MNDPDDRDPRLIWTEAGEPRSGRYGDVYFSAEDGLTETRAVFLAGCGLPDAWQGRAGFTVAELGFGTGLNIAALLHLWRAHRPPGGRLNIFSVEGFPLDVEEARRALSAWPEIAEATEALLARWPAGTPGFHRVDLPEFDAVLDLAVGQAEWALEQWIGRADAWFLDGFAPSTNPDMWSDAILDRLAERSAPDARVATFTVAGAVRRGLAERGFTVEKKPGHGRKRERLQARRAGTPAIVSPPSVAVIGAGIAGAAVTRALATLGGRPIVIEAEQPGAGASGFPSALVTPRFDLGDGDIAALFAQALERAQALYTATPGSVIAEGVIQLAGSERDAARFPRIAHQSVWPGDAMVALSPDAASAALDEAVMGPALSMTSALAVAPSVVVSAWLSGVDKVEGRAARLAPHQGRWRILDAEDALLAEVDRVVVCAGAALRVLIPELALTPVRGQAEWIETGDSPPATAWGGYVAPLADGGFLFGATHDRGDTDREPRRDDRDRNLATLSARLPVAAGRLDPAAIRSRAALRATTRDRLPVAGRVEGRPGVFILGGLGSRGFCLAPLLAEHLAALIAEAPSPLPVAIAARLAPERLAPAPLAPDVRREDGDGV